MKKTEVIIDNDKLLVRRGKETFDKAFSSIEQVKVIKPLLGRSDSFLNRIHVSNQLFEKVGAVALIYNNDTEQWYCIGARASARFLVAKVVSGFNADDVNVDDMDVLL